MAFKEPHFPTVDEIRERAIELFMFEHPGAPTPEEYELKEGSFWNRARSELMSGVRSQLEEYLRFVEGEAKRVREELGEKLEVTPDEVRRLKDQASEFRIKYRDTKKRLEEAEKEIEEAEKRIEELKKLPPPVVPPVVPKPPLVAPPPPPPVKIPPPKVLPPVPEVCPIDETRIEQVERVPMFIKDPLLLSAEEEDWRARAGLPLPTVGVEWIDVPPTMKLWMCARAEDPHYFERDAVGRLIERSPEYVYRKILRERARFERIEYPTVPRLAPITPTEAIYLKPRRPILPKYDEWLRMEKGLEMWQYIKVSEVEKKLFLAEYDKYLKDMTEEE